MFIVRSNLNRLDCEWILMIEVATNESELSFLVFIRVWVTANPTNNEFAFASAHLIFIVRSILNRLDCEWILMIEVATNESELSFLVVIRVWVTANPTNNEFAFASAHLIFIVRSNLNRLNCEWILLIEVATNERELSFLVFIRVWVTANPTNNEFAFAIAHLIFIVRSILNRLDCEWILLIEVATNERELSFLVVIRVWVTANPTNNEFAFASAHLIFIVRSNLNRLDCEWILLIEVATNERELSFLVVIRVWVTANPTNNEFAFASAHLIFIVRSILNRLDCEWILLIEVATNERELSFLVVIRVWVTANPTNNEFAFASAHLIFIVRSILNRLDCEWILLIEVATNERELSFLVVIRVWVTANPTNNEFAFASAHLIFIVRSILNRLDCEWILLIEVATNERELSFLVVIRVWVTANPTNNEFAFASAHLIFIVRSILNRLDCEWILLIEVATNERELSFLVVIRVWVTANPTNNEFAFASAHLIFIVRSILNRLDCEWILLIEVATNERELSFLVVIRVWVTANPTNNEFAFASAHLIFIVRSILNRLDCEWILLIEVATNERELSFLVVIRVWVTANPTNNEFAFASAHLIFIVRSILNRLDCEWILLIEVATNERELSFLVVIRVWVTANPTNNEFAFASAHLIFIVRSILNRLDCEWILLIEVATNERELSFLVVIRVWVTANPTNNEFAFASAHLIFIVRSNLNRLDCDWKMMIEVATNESELSFLVVIRVWLTANPTNNEFAFASAHLIFIVRSNLNRLDCEWILLIEVATNE
ncbi:unnamed protein product [Fasciola hepatica]|uniref:Uncharacterized protein n=1 Tax=Fasciola hepatica TaxID=6192 RepID=A0ABC9HH45_FASHE